MKISGPTSSGILKPNIPPAPSHEIINKTLEKFMVCKNNETNKGNLKKTKTKT